MSKLIQEYQREHLTYWGSFSHVICRKLTAEVCLSFLMIDHISLSLESANRSFLFAQGSDGHCRRLLAWFITIYFLDSRYEEKVIHHSKSNIRFI